MLKTGIKKGFRGEDAHSNTCLSGSFHSRGNFLSIQKKQKLSLSAASLLQLPLLPSNGLVMQQHAPSVARSPSKMHLQNVGIFASLVSNNKNLVAHFSSFLWIGLLLFKKKQPKVSRDARRIISLTNRRGVVRCFWWLQRSCNDCQIVWYIQLHFRSLCIYIDTPLVVQYLLLYGHRRTRLAGLKL